MRSTKLITMILVALTVSLTGCQTTVTQRLEFPECEQPIDIASETITCSGEQCYVSRETLIILLDNYQKLVNCLNLDGAQVHATH